MLIGPWRSEVGFEALYWLPFLRWAAKAHLGDKQVAIVTRGGAASLYAPSVQAVDLYSLRDVRAVHQENIYDSLKTKVQKQMRCTKWDRDVLHDASVRLWGAGIRRRDYHVLHPSWMYWALNPFWHEARGLRHLLSMTEFATIKAPALPDGLTLPERFVAVKFYRRNPTFELTQDVVEFVKATVGIVASQVPVVLLTSGATGDEHSDIIVQGPNITVLPPVPPEQSVTLQAAVLGRAVAFAGTYGGVAQLALRMGIPSVSFWDNFGGTAHAHLSLSQWLAHHSKIPFLTGSIRDAVLWRQVVSLPERVPEPTQPQEVAA